MDTLTCDFETAYDKTLSLGKMSTEEYIRDPRFEVIGVSVKRNKDEAQWYSGTREEIKKWLRQFDWEHSVCIAHNTKFDAAILNWLFDIRPFKLVDTMCMARALHGPGAGASLANLSRKYGIGEKGDEVYNAFGKRRQDFTAEELRAYGEYCINDVELAYLLFLAMFPLMPEEELELIDITLRMFTEPKLKLNEALLRKHLNQIKDEKENLLSKAMIPKEDLMSNDKLAKIIFNQFGIKPPTKISPTTGEETWAFAKTDEGFKKLLEHENPFLRAIVGARLGVKSTIEETRAETFINITKRGPLPVPLKYYGAHTGRFSGEDDINLQNLPRGSLLKAAIEAPDEFLLCDSDSAQIEARTLAWLAKEEKLVQGFANKEDIYREMASDIYRKNEITDPQRFVGKTTILGSGYGMGGTKFQAQLRQFNVYMDADECSRIIGVYRKKYKNIVKLWKKGDQALAAIVDGEEMWLGRKGVLWVDSNGIRLPNGLYIQYPNLRREQGKYGPQFVYDTRKGQATVKKSIWGGGVTENVCQALARLIITDQIIRINRKYRVALTVHDSIVGLVPEAEKEEGQAFIEAQMRIGPDWAEGLPLNCESHIGKTYG